MRLAVDIGGTFTDVVLEIGDVRAGGRRLTRKVLTTPRAPEEAVMNGTRAILKDDDEAEDVMQQAYVNAYVHLEQFAGQAAFSTWLTKIAVYEALARSRRRGAARRNAPSGGSSRH